MPAPIQHDSAMTLCKLEAETLTGKCHVMMLQVMTVQPCYGTMAFHDLSGGLVT